MALQATKWLRALIGLLVPVVCCGMSQEERSVVYRGVIREMEAARTMAFPAATIGKLARQAGEQYSQTDPGLVVNIQFSAVVMLQMKVASDPETRPLVVELKSRQRQLLDAVPLPERLWRLGSQPLPLGMEVSAKTGVGGSLETWTELEYLLRNWRQLRDELGQVQAADVALPQSRPQPPPDSVHAFTNAAGVVVIPTFDQSVPPEFISDPIVREQFRRAVSDYQEQERQREGLLELTMKASLFTNSVIRQVAAEYAKSPHLLAQLQEAMDGYLPPSDSTNVMNKVFASMKPEIAAKTPRPVPGAKGERWIRAPEPRPPPGLPAIAKPSRIRDGIAPRGSQGVMGAVSPGAAAAGAEPVGGGGGGAGGRAVWPWALAGVGVLAWAWLKMRGR